MRTVWEAQPNDVYKMRGAENANLHCARGSKTICFDGNRDARATLAVDGADILHLHDPA